MSRTSIPILQPSPRPAAAPGAPGGSRGMPLLRLGFRPFYLLAAGLATIGVPLWVAVLLGALPAATPLPMLHWHAHEMLFGFAAAVIVGFLLTAGQAWTGLATPRGAALGALALLWLAARVAALTGPLALFAVIDVLLLPAVAVVLARVLLRARNRRNLPLAGLLGLLALANAAFHLSALGVAPWTSLQPLHAALAVVVMVECVIAGRVVPAFTANATPGLTMSPAPRHERLTLGTTAVALAAWVFAPQALVTAAPLLAAAALHVARQARWAPGATLRRPILWVLHAAYAFVPLGLALLALEPLGLAGASPGIHALAVGATGGLVIGMITRTARGHTGRPLAASRAETAAYALVLIAALLRSVVPLAWPLPELLVAAAALWSAAFAIYLWIYVPWLTQARADGKDG